MIKHNWTKVQWAHYYASNVTINLDLFETLFAAAELLEQISKLTRGRTELERVVPLAREVHTQSIALIEGG